MTVAVKIQFKFRKVKKISAVVLTVYNDVFT